MADLDSRSATLAGEKEIGRSVSPTPPASLNKEQNANLDDSTTDNEGSLKDSSAEVAEEDVEYPTGLRMTLIVISLLLSIFLVRNLHS